MHDSKENMENTFNQKLKEAQESNSHIGVCVRVQHGDKFLLLKRATTDSAPGILENAGGSVDEGETLRQAITRELFEEAGIVISEDSLEPIHIFEFLNLEKDTNNIKFAFKVELDSAPKITLSPDHDDFKFLTLAEIESLPRQNRDQEFVLWQDHYTLLTI